MNLKHAILAALVLTLANAQAQTTNIVEGGDLRLPENWSNGLPVGQTGVVARNATISSGTADFVGWNLVVKNGATIIDHCLKTTFGEVIGSSLVIENGGRYDRVGGHRFSGTTTTINGRYKGMNTFVVNDGNSPSDTIITVNANGFLEATKYKVKASAYSSVLNIAGGIANFSANLDVRQSTGANYINVTDGGTLSFGLLGFASNTNSVDNIITLNDGALLSDDFEAVLDGETQNSYINFTDESTASWTWTGATAADFEAAWANNSLQHAGISACDDADFYDHFEVTGDTVVAIPEPGTLGLAAFCSVGLSSSVDVFLPDSPLRGKPSPHQRRPNPAQTGSCSGRETERAERAM